MIANMKNKNGDLKLIALVHATYDWVVRKLSSEQVTSDLRSASQE